MKGCIACVTEETIWDKCMLDALKRTCPCCSSFSWPAPSQCWMNSCKSSWVKSLVLRSICRRKCMASAHLQTCLLSSQYYIGSTPCWGPVSFLASLGSGLTPQSCYPRCAGVSKHQEASLTWSLGQLRDSSLFSLHCNRAHSSHLRACTHNPDTSPGESGWPQPVCG